MNIKSDAHLPLNSTPEEIASAKKEFDDAGIVLVWLRHSLVTFWGDDEADMRSKFEYAKRAGFPLIVAGPTQVTLPKLEKFVEEFDIKLAVHNHGPEDKYFPTPQSVLKDRKEFRPAHGMLYRCRTYRAYRSKRGQMPSPKRDHACLICTSRTSKIRA